MPRFYDECTRCRRPCQAVRIIRWPGGLLRRSVCCNAPMVAQKETY